MHALHVHVSLIGIVGVAKPVRMHVHVPNTYV